MKDVNLMSDNELKIMEILNRENSLSQREISSKADISLGNTNSIIKNLIKNEYIKIKRSAKKTNYTVTEKGLKELEKYIAKSFNKKIVIPPKNNKKIEYAVILAAGERSKFQKPVGLLKLDNETIIERIIRLLRECGIKKIVIITGYENKYFQYMKDEKDIYLIENKQYRWTGTMASLALASTIIDDDFLLIEGDMIFEKEAIDKIIESSNRNCVLITKESGSGDEVFVELKSGFIYKISKDINQFNKIDGEMIGISKISIDIYKKMLAEFKSNQNPYMNYEYMLLDVGRTYNIGYVKIYDLIWTEIDNTWQYKNLIDYIYPILKRKENTSNEKFK